MYTYLTFSLKEKNLFLIERIIGQTIIRFLNDIFHLDKIHCFKYILPILKAQITRKIEFLFFVILLPSYEHLLKLIQCYIIINFKATKELFHLPKGIQCKKWYFY
jgi:hypothetical protein